MTRPKILALSFFPAFVPPTNGGVARLTRLYSELARFCDVTLLTSGEVGAALDRVTHTTGFEEIRVPKDSAFEVIYGDLADADYRGDVSGPANGLWCRHFGQLHDLYLEHYPSTDIIIHDSPFLLDVDCFRDVDQKTRVYNSYNVEADLYESFGKTGAGRKIATLVASLERELVGSVDLITACSTEDRARFLEAYNPSCPITIVPNGVQLPARQETNTANEVRLVFLGSNHKPNNDAARRIVEEIGPQVPDIPIDIVGSCMAPGRYGNVTAHGLLDEEAKNDVLMAATAAINPVITGSGSSLKIAEFAAWGIPLISTRHGARGFEMIPDEHYLAAEPTEMAAAIRRLLGEKEEMDRLASAAEGHIRSHFGWESIAQRLYENIQAIRPADPADRPFLVLNDYDSFEGAGGGATRTVGLCRGLRESRPVLFVTLVDEPGNLCSVYDGIVVLRVPKTVEHRRSQRTRDETHWMSIADVTSYQYAPRNERLVRLFEAALPFAEKVVCEHPYMVGLPRLFGSDFVYSSQNCELQLKRSTHTKHPSTGELMSLVEECESYACGASSLIVAVSDDDANLLSGLYDYTAPIIVIRNGSDGVPGDLSFDTVSDQDSRLSCIFMGSGHAPNVAGAQWIIDDLAPRCPEIDFVLMGSVCTTIGEIERPNVRMLGVVSEAAKHEAMAKADVALNPISSGSGSNIKVADYLQHGLKVLSTPFGARGYDDVGEADLVVSRLEAFASSLRGTGHDPAAVRLKRAKRYQQRLSMVEGGRTLASLMLAPAKRKRALYVTYRYLASPKGGGEVYVDRLVQALADRDWSVDVACADVDKIVDVSRFGAAFVAGRNQNAPVGHPAIRVAKFKSDGDDVDAKKLREIWRAQPAFEEKLLQSLPAPEGSAALGWGWAWPDPNGRWSFDDCGIFSAGPTELEIKGRASGNTWVQLLDDEGTLLDEQTVDGPFTIRCSVKAGWTRISARRKGGEAVADPRPLGFFATAIRTGSEDILRSDALDASSRAVDPSILMAAFNAARLETRHSRGLQLSSLRNPSASLDQFVSEQVGDYDLLITHNAIFGSSTHAVAAAKKASVPSIMVPHLHLDDDFYHFDDVLDACRQASETLVCPSSAADFLESQGLDNVRPFTPGIEADEQYCEADEAAFRAVLKRDEPFFLVLGRKAGAKRYGDIIAAAKKVDRSPLVVLIGPDDDGIDIEGENVVYLGLQPRSIVRGALRSCTALVNMSASESFGIVLLEAGAAGRPVIANRHCAAFSDLVIDGKNGFLRDRTDLAEAMSRLLEDEGLARRMGEAGKQLAQRYAWPAIEEKFVDLCDSIVRDDDVV